MLKKRKFNKLISGLRQGKESAARGLGDLGDVRAIGELRETLRNTENNYLVDLSAEALRKLGDASVTTILHEIMNDKNRGALIRSTAAQKLGDFGDVNAIEQLLDNFQQDHSDLVQLAALTSLEKISKIPQESLQGKDKAKVLALKKMVEEVHAQSRRSNV